MRDQAARRLISFQADVTRHAVALERHRMGGQQAAQARWLAIPRGQPSRGLLRGMVVADRQRRQLLVADLVLAVQREQRRRDVGPA
jgi:hypothetical protein